MKQLLKEAVRDLELDKLCVKANDLKKKYRWALRELRKKETEVESILELKQATQSFEILPRKKTGGEATAVLVASDWHIDEVVKPQQVSGLNHFNPQIAKRRAEYFFRNGLKLIKMFGRDVEINTIILPLLGDFISGEIHEELMEGNSMLPMEAILYAKELLMSGIEFLLSHSDYKIIIPCVTGNHSRITARLRHATEKGNSLEFFMYHTMAQQLKDKRVKFVIPEGYHCYVGVYDYILRLHHGHAIRYAGGVGGVYIPVNKAIAQWNKAKSANLDVFGHFHQFKDGGNFNSNGSLIGYNAFALSIKADYEEPKQTLFLIDKKRGKTLVCPVILKKA